MAKRFTDTGKWDKAWFRKLSPTEKCVWMFLCDRCDHAGVWEIDIDALEFFVGTKWRICDLESTFGDKIKVVGETKLLVTGFIDFQYGDLNPDNRVHKSVLNRLEKLAPSKPLISTLEGAKDKDKDKEQDKAKDKDKEKEPRKFKISKAQLDDLYSTYPRKEGKSRGYSKLTADIGSIADLEQCHLAVANYIAKLKTKGTEGDFIKLFSTFAHEWRDWIDPSHGTAADFSENNELNPDDYKMPEPA